MKNTYSQIKFGPLFMAILVTFQSVFPYQVFALTGGPSQPEVQSFEPIGTNQMVDLFSGDFNYNIPLLTVPGPNGGYPINMAYHAGATMEEEASWVGLGWNINPGVINRGMRGLPDDFNGDKIKKERYAKKNYTLALGGGFNFEHEAAFVGDAAKSNIGVHAAIRYNNYRGFDFTKGVSASATLIGGLGVSASLSQDTENGTTFTPGVSFSKQFGKSGISQGLNYSKSVNTRQGVQPSVFGANGNSQLGLDYSSSSLNAFNSFIPSSGFEMKGFNVKGSLELGSSNFGIYTKLFDVWASYDESSIKEKEQSLNAYGYMYSENAGYKDLMDFNREKDGAIYDDSPRLPLPIYTGDIFSTSGHGIGGTFRPFRNDVAILGDPIVRSKLYGGDGSVEYGSGAGFHFGFDAQVTINTLRQGQWNDAISSLKNNGYGFKDVSGQNTTFTPFFFKNTSELSASRSSNVLAKKALSVNSTAKSSGVKIFSLPNSDDFVIKDQFSYNNASVNDFLARDEFVGDMMSYKTLSELKGLQEQSSYYSYIYPTNNTADWHMEDNGYTIEEKGHLLGEVSVVNSSGMKYVYGLPAMNKKTETYTFAIDEVETDLNKVKKNIEYNSGDCGTNNNNGLDHFYEKTEVPDYAHSFHLTAIYSSDYIDLTRNGPTPDDFGSYVKFDYQQVSSDYKWRVPFYNANLSIGNLSHVNSDKHDDKANFTYGEKEIYYLSNITTKTHRANFITEERLDGKGVDVLHQKSLNDGGELGASVHKLKQIDLYVLNDDQTNGQKVKSVHFNHDYSLCKKVYNNDDPTESGKLTLKNIWFTNGNDNGGILNRYTFDYNTGATDGSDNKYDPVKMDRWGNYDSEMTDADYNFAPFVKQNKTEAVREKEVSFWNLKTIHLPSGADINIEYESDTYSYVQDKKAMNMYRVLGMSKKDGSDFVLSNTGINKDTYLIVETPEGIPIEEFLGQIEDVYFKTYLKLYKDKSNKEFVEGFGKIDITNSTTSKVYNSSNAVQFNDKECLLLKLKPTKLGEKISTHPVRAAGIRYLKNQRADIDAPGLEPIVNPLSIIIDLLDVIDLFRGYYKISIVEGKANTFVNNNTFKSFVRLNSHNKKYGGGHRVKSIVINDKWAEFTDNAGEDFYQGQTYTYEDPHTKKSFGVCSYEPFVGSEENPFKTPLYFKGDSYIVDEESHVVDNTYGEQFQPSPSVGYSKVIVQNITRNKEYKNEDTAQELLTKKSGAGIVVNEFYTTKEYPTVITYSNPKSNSSRVKNVSIFPFLGSFTTDYAGYSQSYQVYLNDMNGKQKKVSTYRSTQNVFDPNVLPVTFNAFEYHTKQIADSEGKNRNVLNPNVQVMGERGTIQTMHLGESKEFYVDTRQDKSSYDNLGLSANVDLFNYFMPPPLFNAQVQFTKSIRGFGSLVTVEVLNRRGILSKSTSFDRGKRVVTQNKVYDAYSGAPILTSVDNDQRRKVYALNMLAHQQYPEMGSKHDNTRNKIYLNWFEFTSSSGSDYYNIPASYNPYLESGDLVSVKSISSDESVTHQGLYSVKLVDGSGAQLVGYSGDESITVFSNVTYEVEVLESGKTNQLTASIGNAVSLNENIAGLMYGHHDLLTWINSVQPIDQNIIKEAEVQAYVDHLNETSGSSSQQSPICIQDHINVGAFGQIQEKAFNTDNICDKYTLKIDFVNENSDAICSSYKTGYAPFTKLEMRLISHERLTNGEISDINDNFFEKSLPCTKPSAHYYFSETDVISCDQKDENNQMETFEWIDFTDLKTALYQKLPVCFDILDASTITYSDDWTYDKDVMPTDASLYTNTGELKEEYQYLYGEKGKWKPNKQYVSLNERKEDNINNSTGVQFEPELGISGVYDEFAPYEWNTGNPNPSWTQTNEITKYSPFGFELENKNALNQYSSELLGHKNTLPIAMINNARHDEFGFTSLEAFSAGVISEEHSGNLTLKGNDLAIINNGKGHSGNASLKFGLGSSVELMGKKLDPEKTYLFSAWVKGDYVCSAPCSDWEAYYMYKTTTGVQKIEFDVDQINFTHPIEGWRKLEIVFEAPTGSIQSNAIEHGLSIKYSPYIAYSGQFIEMDDIRIQPFHAQMKSVVYDLGDLKVISELDDQNFATFYNYDVNRNLDQIKKETIRGIKTLQSTKQNIPRVNQ